MIVGLGTGSTAAFAIAALGQRCREGLAIRAVATSQRTEAAARAEGISIIDFADVAAIDLCIDGVDEIDPDLRAIKGAGGALLREKIVAQAARRMVAICGGGKQVPKLGRGPLPIEVLPFAHTFVAARIADLGGAPVLRIGENGAPYRTDQDNVVLDCGLPQAGGIGAFVMELQHVAGVLGHGYFPDEIDALYVGQVDDVMRIERSGTE